MQIAWYINEPDALNAEPAFPLVLGKQALQFDF